MTLSETHCRSIGTDRVTRDVVLKTFYTGESVKDTIRAEQKQMAAIRVTCIEGMPFVFIQYQLFH